MAQTKRRRRTKHRGNAAGVVEARGRTGRPTEGAGAGKPSTREEARQRRLDRLDRPPTWKGAINRAAIATVFFAILVILIFKQPVGSAMALAAFMLLLYIPLSYYTDLLIYRRRQARKSRTKG